MLPCTQGERNTVEETIDRFICHIQQVHICLLYAHQGVSPLISWSSLCLQKLVHTNDLLSQHEFNGLECHMLSQRE